MVRPIQEMTAQRRPEGIFWPSPPEWKQAVLDQLAANKRNRVGICNQSQLAKAIGITTAGVTQMLRMTGPIKKIQPQTRLKPQVHAALGWAPPADSERISVLDEHRVTLNNRWDDLTPSERAQIAGIAVSLTERKKK